MNKIYHLVNINSDYDTLNNMVVVAVDGFAAVAMIPEPYNKLQFTRSMIGYTDKPLNTIILQDY